MKKNLLCVFSLLVLFGFNSSLIYSQEKIDATFEAGEGKILIHYELKGDSQKDYEVSIVLKRTSDHSFAVIPDETTGDIGEGKFAGKKSTITWLLNSDEEEMLDGDDFYFDVFAEEIKTGGGIPWYVYIGGAALAGGTAAILLLNKSSDEETPPASFPTPPARP